MTDPSHPSAFPRSRSVALIAAALCVALGAPAMAQVPAAEMPETRPGSNDPDIMGRTGELPLGYVAKWENYTPDGRFLSETTMILAEKSSTELVWEVRHSVLADEAISNLIRQAALDGKVRLIRDDADGLLVQGVSVTDRRMRFIRKDTAFGAEFNSPHDCAYTFSLCRFTRTLPGGDVFHLVRWGELFQGIWITRVNHDPWKDPGERRSELFNGRASVALDGLPLDDVEIWDGEVLSILHRIIE
ncbi:MAG: hypothetical protein ACJA1L_001250 [Paracoccaceae bacterium]|jgi:hypothetical protein